MSTATIPETAWTAQYPELGTGPVPVEPCISAEYFELERERIFRRVWLNVCREEEIPNPGDYLVKDIAVVNASIIVVRGKDGRIRAFHNVCRHRGNKLAWAGDGQGSSCKAFQCRFHGWTYQLDGTLASVPDEAQFFDFDKSEYGLKAVAADVWEGFVFIHLDPDPPESLRDYLGELGEGLVGYPFARYTACHGYRAEIDVNWKVCIDAFQEFYHVAFIHKRSVAKAVGGPDNPLAHPLTLKLYPRHRTFSGPANLGYEPRPVEVASFSAGLAVLAQFSDHVGLSEMPQGVNPTQNEAWSMDIHMIFPHFVLGVMRGMYYTYHFWPVAVDRSVFEARIYQSAAMNAGERFSQEHTRIEARDTLFEDLNTMERTQAALRTGALEHFVLQDNELLVRHLHHVVQQFVGPSIDLVPKDGRNASA